MFCNIFRYLCIFKDFASRDTFNISFKGNAVGGDYFLLVFYVAGTQKREKMRRKGWEMDWIDQCNSSSSFGINDYSSRNIY